MSQLAARRFARDPWINRRSLRRPKCDPETPRSLTCVEHARFFCRTPIGALGAFGGSNERIGLRPWLSRRSVERPSDVGPRSRPLSASDRNARNGVANPDQATMKTHNAGVAETWRVRLTWNFAEFKRVADLRLRQRYRARRILYRILHPGRRSNDIVNPNETCAPSTIHTRANGVRGRPRRRRD